MTGERPPTVLDGGVGQELVRRAGAPATPLWSTRVLLDAPDLVATVHDDFFRAGADVATANTYGLLPDRLDPHGIGGELERLHAIACGLAVGARDRHGAGLVAGSLGPVGHSYRPDLAAPVDDAAALYARLGRLQAPFVDVLLCETMASVDQARGAVRGAAEAGLPVWLAVTVADEDGTRLRSGEPVEAVGEVVETDRVDALLVNCSPPEAVGAALHALVAAGLGDDLPLGAYANGFTRITDEFRTPGATVDALEARDDLSPERYASHAARWRDLGATIIGGCCEVGPAHVRTLAATLGSPRDLTDG